MKKNIFVLSTLMLISSNVLAQTEQEPSLFPELDFGVIQAEVEDNDVSLIEAETLLNEQADIQEETDQGVQQTEEAAKQEGYQEGINNAVKVSESQPKIEQETTAEEEEELEQDKNRLIYLALNNVKNYSSPIKTVSYCSGDFILFNDTKRIIQEISGTLDIGDQQEEFKFENVIDLGDFE